MSDMHVAVSGLPREVTGQVAWAWPRYLPRSSVGVCLFPVLHVALFLPCDSGSQDHPLPRVPECGDAMPRAGSGSPLREPLFSSNVLLPAEPQRYLCSCVAAVSALLSAGANPHVFMSVYIMSVFSEWCQLAAFPHSLVRWVVQARARL